MKIGLSTMMDLAQIAHELIYRRLQRLIRLIVGRRHVTKCLSSALAARNVQEEFETSRVFGISASARAMLLPVVNLAATMAGRLTAFGNAGCG